LLPRPRRARPEDGRADADQRRALLDRHLEVAAHAHRELGEPVPLAELAERAKPRARALRVGRLGRDRHEPAYADVAEPGHRAEQRAEPVGRRPARSAARATRSRTRWRLARMSCMAARRFYGSAATVASRPRFPLRYE